MPHVVTLKRDALGSREAIECPARSIHDLRDDVSATAGAGIGLSRWGYSRSSGRVTRFPSSVPACIEQKPSSRSTLRPIAARFSDAGEL